MEYADFVEACRNQKLIDYNIHTQNVSPHRLNGQDLSRPNFAVEESEELRALMAEVSQANRDRSPPLPFEEFALFIGDYTVILVEREAQDGPIRIIPFVHEKSHNPDGERWASTGEVVIEVDGEIGGSHVVGARAIEPSLERSIVSMHQWAAGICHVLALPITTVEAELPSPSMRRANSNRPSHMRRLTPPNRIVIDISKTRENVARVSNGSSGIERSPHDRRAHTRRITRADGTVDTIFVKAAKIKGGGKQAQRYAVRV